MSRDKGEVDDLGWPENTDGAHPCWPPNLTMASAVGATCTQTVEEAK